MSDSNESITSLSKVSDTVASTNGYLYGFKLARDKDNQNLLDLHKDTRFPSKVIVKVPTTGVVGSDIIIEEEEYTLNSRRVKLAWAVAALSVILALFIAVFIFVMIRKFKKPGSGSAFGYGRS